MRDDTREELERLERELLAEDDTLDLLADLPEGLREEVQEGPDLDLPEEKPAFEDPETIHTPKKPMVYCNYSNDYGRDLKNFAESGGEVTNMARKKKSDRVLIGLMATESFLCLAIIGVLIYWLEVFLT